jgi:hypothetical protein
MRAREILHKKYAKSRDQVVALQHTRLGADSLDPIAALRIKKIHFSYHAVANFRRGIADDRRAGCE